MGRKELKPSVYMFVGFFVTLVLLVVLFPLYVVVFGIVHWFELVLGSAKAWREWK